MTIGKFRHRGLERLYADDDPTGLPPAHVRRIRNVLAALEAAASLAQLQTMPGWRLHRLRGDRRDEYSISVSANWRITFRVVQGVVNDVRYEDYH